MIGKGFNIWDKDYFKSLDLCIHKNGLFPASNYCQEKSKQSGQMTWTNVFRDEIEIMKTKGNFVKSIRTHCWYPIIILFVICVRQRNNDSSHCVVQNSCFVWTWSLKELQYTDHSKISCFENSHRTLYKFFWNSYIP